MQKIVTHLWYDKEAKEAANFYTSLFDNSKITSVSTITGTPSGDCDIVNFTLAGQDFMAISAGPYFKFNPSISLSVVCESEDEIKTLWDKLNEGGKVLMEYNTYPWADKYGWVADKYGLTWQLSWKEGNKANQKITPSLMFTQDLSGKAKEAMQFYTSIFPDSKIENEMLYGKDDGDTEGFVKHATFVLAGQYFSAMDSSGPHEFKFNEAVSLIVHCKDQEEIDYYWEKLSAVPESEQCGWLKDTFGVSWQIVPVEMNEMMQTKDKEKLDRVTKAFLQMKKFDIAELKRAYNGE